MIWGNNGLYMFLGTGLIGWNFGYEYNDIGSYTMQNKFIIMQYTGLKDKNGKEIFEGDILEHYVNFGPGGDQPGYKTAIELTGFGVNVQHWMFEEVNKQFMPEIIGNIYENPELL